MIDKNNIAHSLMKELIDIEEQKDTPIPINKPECLNIAEKIVKNINYDAVLACVFSELKEFVDIDDTLKLGIRIATKEERIKHAELKEKYKNFISLLNAR